MKKNPPPIDHAEIYARELLSRQKKARAKALDIPGLGQQIQTLCVERMTSARAAGVTHLCDFVTNQDDTSIALVGQGGSVDPCFATVSFFPPNSGFTRLIMRSLLRLMGRDRFCDYLASSLCSILANEEALSITRRNAALPHGAIAIEELDELAKASPAAVAPSKPASRL